MLNKPLRSERRHRFVIRVRLAVVQGTQGIEVGGRRVREDARHQLRRHATLARLREHFNRGEAANVGGGGRVAGRDSGDRQVAQVMPVGKSGRWIQTDASATEERDVLRGEQSCCGVRFHLHLLRGTHSRQPL